VKLEAISLMRLLPAGAADLGDVTREELREASHGEWSALLGRKDDLRDGLAPADAPTEECEVLPGYDTVVPLAEAQVKENEPVIELRFSEG
jgi:hypothetical protein